MRSVLMDSVVFVVFEVGVGDEEFEFVLGLRPG